MNAESIQSDIKSCVESRDLRRVRDFLVDLRPADIAETLKGLDNQEKAVVLRILPQELATETFEYLDIDSQKGMLGALGDERVAKILNEMAPDDRTALLEEFPAAAAKQLLSLLSKDERAIALTLLGYPEHSVGRLMTPDYVVVEPEWNMREVLDYVREHGHDSDTINVLYVLDEKGKLIDDVRMREILLANPNKRVLDLMNYTFVALQANDDQEKAVEIFKKYDRFALPVLDSHGIMIGIITVDDVLDIAEKEATEDIHKIGGTEALDYPYMATPIGSLIQKRAGWLVILFLGEMLTATAMGYFEKEISRAVVLALFIPLIISSGGNSGSQAASLIIRALAIGEITVADWFKVVKRELVAGFALGMVLGLIGFLRIALWSSVVDLYGPHWALIGVAVGLSLLGVVLWGVLSGATLPILLKRLGLDPATSSAPFVATLVDVTGLIIYFSVASMILKGTLL